MHQTQIKSQLNFFESLFGMCCYYNVPVHVVSAGPADSDLPNPFGLATAFDLSATTLGLCTAIAAFFGYFKESAKCDTYSTITFLASSDLESHSIAIIIG